MPFDWKEEERITAVVMEHMKKKYEVDVHQTSIVWRHGNDFVVAVWANITTPSPEWDQATKYYEQHCWHICLRVVWKEAKRFLRILETHESGALTWIGNFACSSCGYHLGHESLRWRR